MAPEAIAPEVLPDAMVTLPDWEAEFVAPVTRLTAPEVAPLASPLVMRTLPLPPPAVVPLLNSITPELPADNTLPERMMRTPEDEDVPFPEAMNT